MDVFWPGVIAVEHKSAGEDLGAAMAQAMDYLPGLRPEHHPRLVVVSDFARMVVRDLDADTKVEFPLADLAAHVQLFAVLTGRRRRRVSEGDEVEVNLTATFLLRNLHDALKASGYDSHPLRVLMVRVLFALFADDTEVWEQDLFHSWLLEQTREDGSDLGSALSHLWQVLNTAPELRSTNLEETLRAFAYINGGLFKETLPIPDFTRDMRESLIECCLFDWSAISPAIFGSLFQEVMTPLARRQIGAHYTTEQNILRTIEPLFLAELRRELDAATTRPALVRFRSRLASLTFFDPACGCGNFLVIAYREIRKIETECLRRLRARDKANTRQDVLDVTVDSQVRVGQFYGIEIEEFPVRIAETAMYLMDHLENRALGREFGGYHVRFPIADTAHIHLGNALRIDWHQVLPARECSYLFGNPPFVGKKARSTEQQADMDLVFHGRRGAGTLDYVTAWYDKAAAYIAGTDTLVAFVSTNSIVQGEQVPILWPPLLADGLEIGFAHRTFAWTSEARGKASVHCVIIGFASGAWPGQRQIFDYATPRSETHRYAEPKRSTRISSMRRQSSSPGAESRSVMSRPPASGRCPTTTEPSSSQRMKPPACGALIPSRLSTFARLHPPVSSFTGNDGGASGLSTRTQRTSGGHQSCSSGSNECARTARVASARPRKHSPTPLAFSAKCGSLPATTFASHATSAKLGGWSQCGSSRPQWWPAIRQSPSLVPTSTFLASCSPLPSQRGSGPSVDGSRTISGCLSSRSTIPSRFPSQTPPTDNVSLKQRRPSLRPGKHTPALPSAICTTPW